MKQFGDEVWPLMAKYIVNETSATERLAMDKLLKECDELLDIYRKLQPYYETTGESDDADAVEAFRKLDARIRKDS